MTIAEAKMTIWDRCQHCKETEEALKFLTDSAGQGKTGKWEMKPDPYGFFDEIHVCSVCGCTNKWREKYPYCTHCGAKMEVDE